MNAPHPDTEATADPVRVLYVAPGESIGEAVESAFADERPAVALSFVTSLAGAMDALDAERVDYVVLDSAVAESVGADETGARSGSATTGGVDIAAAVRRRAPDASVETVRGIDAGGASDGAGTGSRHSESERPRALAQRIASAVTAETVADGGVEGEHFRALAEELSDAVIVIDAESVVRYANPAVEELFGYPPRELVGESLTTLMPPDLAERHREGVRRYLREGERRVDWRYLELTGQRCDGTEIPLGVSFSEFDTGEGPRFTGIVRDISERKRREFELRDRVDQQEALATFSQRALGDEPLADLMDAAVELVVDALDTDYCKVLELRPESDDLLLRAGVGWRAGIVGSATVGTRRDSQAGYTLLSKEPVVVEDLDAEDRFSGPDLLTSHDVSSGISTVIGSPDDPWGILGAHDTARRSYADHEVQFVQSMAHILATVVRRRERQHQLERSEAMLDAVSDGVYALDADSRFVAVNDAYVQLTGYDRERLLGARASTVAGDDFHDGGDWVRDALEAGEDAVTLDGTLTTADGESVPVEARVAPLELGDGMGRVGVVRDVSDRKRRERKLTSLNEMLRSLADAETRGDICELGVETAVEVLEFPNAAVALYDDERGRLVPTVRRWSGDDADDALLGTDGDDAAWRAFVENEARSWTDLSAAVDTDTEMESALVVPLGKYGVFVAAAPDRAAFDATDRSLADMLCSNVLSALDRAEREVELREQRNDLRAKNRELERVNRLNSVIREITKALTQASTPEDVMQAVCDRLTDAGPYRFAWFGTHDRITDAVEPEARAGVEQGYLDAVSVNAADEDRRGGGPSGRAIRTKETQIQNDLLGDPPFDPWREEALKRGYRSSASVPVAYGGTLRGVLNLYADETDVFDELERTVLSELGETIGYALNALEQKQALVSERSVELDFRIDGTESPVLAFVAETDAEFEFENAVQRGDGRLHAFFTVRDAPADRVLGFAEGVSWVDDVRLVTEREGEFVFEAVLTDESFLRSLVDRGAMPRSLTATPAEGRFVIRIPRSADVRTYVDLFEEYYDDAQLVARRERDEPVMTQQDFESELSRRLTQRQAEVLRTAYFGGFFEWPRESTAQEVADALGVSQPTVSRHIRGAERTLFGLLFED